LKDSSLARENPAEVSLMKSSDLCVKIPFGRRTISANFDGGSLSSDAGLLLLREVDKKLGLTGMLAGCVKDGRAGSRVKVTIAEMLRQRVMGIAAGYEDCNDHDMLKCDPVLKLASGRDPVSDDDLASQPTLSRFENSISSTELWRMEEVLLEMFISGLRGKRISRLVIDADATDDPAHGQQEFEFFHGFYDCHCFLPLLVYVTADDGEQELVASVLRPGNVHAGHRLVSILKRIVPRLAGALPDAQIVFRGDAGMALPAVYDFCEDAGIYYVVSLPKNSRLLELGCDIARDALAIYEETGEKVRHFGEFRYAAHSWRHERRVVMKAEVMSKGENPRFVATNILEMPDTDLYEFYCERGDVENRIKELKDDLLSGRTSCHSFLANQFRLVLHSAAFVLMQALRKLLAGTSFANAQVSTLRSRLLKVGVRVRETTRRIWLKMPTSYPLQEFWMCVVSRLGLARA
jgi:hypothetical protein